MLLIGRRRTVSIATPTGSHQWNHTVSCTSEMAAAVTATCGHHEVSTSSPRAAPTNPRIVKVTSNRPAPTIAAVGTLRRVSSHERSRWNGSPRREPRTKAGVDVNPRYQLAGWTVTLMPSASS